MESHKDADVCVINSCTVTAQADRKTRYLVRRIHRDNPAAIIAVTGCYVQLHHDGAAALEGVAIALGNDRKGELFDRVEALVSGRQTLPETACGGFFAAFSSGDRTRAFLKVQDGCDYRCAYCAIPDARGPSRNIPIAQVVAEAERIAAGGQREIVLTGINTGDFGRTTGEKFLDLLLALENVAGIDRYRISSIEPNLLSDEIIAFTAHSELFMPHFHIPLQSGCDRILELMRRRYTTERFAERVSAVRKAMPDAFIGIDLITAFPGETEGDHEVTCTFLEQLQPSYIHIFPYSRREGTPAAKFDGQTSAAVSERRAAELALLNGRFNHLFYSRFVGTNAEMLVESADRGGLMSGFTRNYLRVELPYDHALAGKLIDIRLASVAASGAMTGEILRAKQNFSENIADIIEE